MGLFHGELVPSSMRARNLIWRRLARGEVFLITSVVNGKILGREFYLCRDELDFIC